MRGHTLGSLCAIQRSQVGRSTHSSRNRSSSAAGRQTTNLRQGRLRKQTQTIPQPRQARLSPLPNPQARSPSSHRRHVNLLPARLGPASLFLLTETLFRGARPLRPFLNAASGFALDFSDGLPNAARVPKWVKMLLAIVLLPACVGAGRALWLVIRASGGADTTWVPFLAGAACWLVVFVLLPKPMWIYVFGHELTHALWTWLFGGRVKRFKATANGGHVVVSKTNFLIALAPYFFPVYAVLVLLGFGIGHWLWDWSAFRGWFHLLLGVAYAFHLTLTWHILQTRQTDITSQGWLFSAVIIFLGNVGVLLVGIPLLTDRGSLLTSLGWWLKYTGEAFHSLARIF